MWCSCIASNVLGCTSCAFAGSVDKDQTSKSNQELYRPIFEISSPTCLTDTSMQAEINIFRILSLCTSISVEHHSGKRWVKFISTIHDTIFNNRMIQELELPFNKQKIQRSKMYRPMSACANCAGWHGSILLQMHYCSMHMNLMNKVRNKETTEQMHSRNTGTGQDSNLERPDERPIP